VGCRLFYMFICSARTYPWVLVFVSPIRHWKAIATIPPARLVGKSLVTYLLPITAVFWGAALLNETLGINTSAGLLLICAGIFQVNRP